MKVLDLRVRAARDWQRRGEQGVRTADGSGQPWWVRGAATWMDRIQAYRVSQRPAPPPDPWIVSVGNLALGGTGKTPVVAKLARDLAAAGHRGCVLTRGYGSPLAGPLRVDADNPGAGDEARMLAADLADCGWTVVQSRNRRRGLSWLIERIPEARIVLLEDGHQTRVGRHLDILIVDSWQVPEAALVPVTGAVFPFGPWRESARGAARADLVLVEESNPLATTAVGQPVTGFQRRLVLDPMERPDRGWAALSGVARPQRFEVDVAAVLGRPADLAIRCDDHATYDSPMVARITSAMRDTGSPTTVTTAKDWIKLKDVWPRDLPVLVAAQELVWTGAKALPDLVRERLEDRRREV